MRDFVSVEDSHSGKRIFDKVMKYAQSEELFNALENNRYAYPYNAPGFEMPYILCSMDEGYELAERYFWKQTGYSLDPESLNFSKNTTDSVTLTSRIYELSYCEPHFLEKLTVHEIK